MKKILYILTMIINTIGSIFSLSLFIFASTFSFQNLSIVMACSAIFIISLTITIIDYKNIFKTKPIIINYPPHKPNCNEIIINDYKNYFVSKKTDFIIC